MVILCALFLLVVVFSCLIIVLVSVSNNLQLVYVHVYSHVCACKESDFWEQILDTFSCYKTWNWCALVIFTVANISPEIDINCSGPALLSLHGLQILALIKDLAPFYMQWNVPFQRVFRNTGIWPWNLGLPPDNLEGLVILMSLSEHNGLWYMASKHYNNTDLKHKINNNKKNNILSLNSYFVQC